MKRDLKIDGATTLVSAVAAVVSVAGLLFTVGTIQNTVWLPSALAASCAAAFAAAVTKLLATRRNNREANKALAALAQQQTGDVMKGLAAPDITAVLSPERFHAITQRAYDAVADYQKHSGLPLPIGPEVEDARRMAWVLDFAQRAANAHVIRASETAIDLGGFASWLVVDPGRGAFIMVDDKAIEKQSTATGVPRGTLFARSVLHELGHLMLHSDLYAAAESRIVDATREPLQEHEAWLFAMTVLGLVFGLASHVRTTQKVPT